MIAMCAHAEEKPKPAPGEMLRRLAAQIDSGRVDSSLMRPKAYVDSLGPRRLVYFTREDLALPAASLQAAVDSAVRAGATDLLVDMWTRATVPYFGSSIARPDSAIAGADPLTVIARAASDAKVRAWLFLSSGFTVWESPLSRPDEGPFVRSHRGMTAVRRDGTPGYADSTAGVWRYAMSPQQLDVHRFLFNVLKDTMSRYPVFGVALDGIEFPSDDYSYDKISIDMFTNLEGVDPRNMDKTDLQYLDWLQWRNEQMRVFPSSLYRAMRRTFPDCQLGWFVRPSTTRETHVQEWSLAVNRGNISWLAVRPEARTGEALRAYVGNTHGEANGVPWGFHLDTSLPLATLSDQVSAMRAMGGTVVVLPALEVAKSATTWEQLWSAQAPRPSTPVPSSPKKSVRRKK